VEEEVEEDALEEELPEVVVVTKPEETITLELPPTSRKDSVQP
jgi:hypothetical protein